MRSNRRSETGDSQLYPSLAGMDIEMSTLNEERVSSNTFVYLISFLNL